MRELMHLSARNPASPLDPSVLMGDRWQFILAMSASELDLYMSDVENRHGHCKAHATVGHSAELMQAKHVLRESQLFKRVASGQIATTISEPQDLWIHIAGVHRMLSFPTHLSLMMFQLIRAGLPTPTRSHHDLDQYVPSNHTICIGLGFVVGSIAD